MALWDNHAHFILPIKPFILLMINFWIKSSINQLGDVLKRIISVAVGRGSFLQRIVRNITNGVCAKIEKLAIKI
jgi:hypothetical protein